MLLPVSQNFRRLLSSPLVVQSRHVAYSVQMVADIARNYNAALDAPDMTLARCMLDAYYVHIRLLADFLVRTTSSKDFGPADFDVAWDPPPSDASRRLNEAWDVASKYVVHFGRPRVPAHFDDRARFPVGEAYFRRLATDALDLYSIFVEAVAAHTPAWSEEARIPDPVHDEQSWRARVRADALAVLREAESVARARLAP